MIIMVPTNDRSNGLRYLLDGLLQSASGDRVEQISIIKQIPSERQDLGILLLYNPADIVESIIGRRSKVLFPTFPARNRHPAAKVQVGGVNEGERGPLLYGRCRNPDSPPSSVHWRRMWVVVIAQALLMLTALQSDCPLHPKQVGVVGPSCRPAWRSGFLGTRWSGPIVDLTGPPPWPVLEEVRLLAGESLGLLLRQSAEDSPWPISCNRP